MRKPSSIALALLTTLVLPACRSAAPKATGAGGPAAPDALRPLVGDVRMLRVKADARAITLKAGQTPAGECDLAVRVRSAVFEKDGARFALDTVGRPDVAGRREPPCVRFPPGVQLVMAGLSSSASDVLARADAVLLTPEAYLRARGIAFDLPPGGEPPRNVASPDESAPGPERLLGLKVTAWPKLLFSVSPYFHDLSGRVHQESDVEFDAVVGVDGRLHAPKLRTTLSQAHQDLVLGALSRWRYEPARTKDGPVPAWISSRLAFRIY